MLIPEDRRAWGVARESSRLLNRSEWESNRTHFGDHRYDLTRGYPSKGPILFTCHCVGYVTDKITWMRKFLRMRMISLTKEFASLPSPYPEWNSFIGAIGNSQLAWVALPISRSIFQTVCASTEAVFEVSCGWATVSKTCKAKNQWTDIIEVQNI